MPTIIGTEDDDILTGEEGDDEIHGLGGDDIIIEESLTGFDQIFGGEGNDLIRVRRHQDPGGVLIDAGAGNDRIEAWTTVTPAYNTITTGTGADILSLDGKFIVTDFSVGDSGDRIDWTPVLARLQTWDQASNPFAGGQRLRVIDQGGSAVIQYSIAGNATWQDLVYLQGVTAAQLTAFNLSGLTLNGAAPTNLVLTGTAAGETLQGFAGNDTIDGLAGNDIIYGGIGNDTIHGGDNDDIIDGELGADTLFGDGGNDTIVDNFGGTGSMDGGAGNDSLTVNLSAISYTVAAPLINPYSFVRAVTGGAGDDLISFVARRDTQATIDGGADNDEIHYAGSDTNISITITGGDGDDLIDVVGGTGVTVDAGSGNDIVVVGRAGTGFSNNPTITLGSGVDTVRINPAFLPQGAHITDFQTGNGGDVVDLTTLLDVNPTGWSYSGNPVHLTQQGANVALVVNSGNALLIFDNRTIAQFTAENFGGFPPNGSEPATAVIDGTEDDDTLTGTVGDDTIHGFGGNDTIYGGYNDDVIYGGDGADMLDGQGGVDRIEGEGGDDILVDTQTTGGAVAGTLLGGDGNDSLTISRTNAVGLNSLLDGGAGDDVISATRITGTILGGSGNDIVTMIDDYDATLTVNLGSGDDILNLTRSDIRAVGSTLTLGAGRDLVTPNDQNTTQLDVLDFQAGEAGDRLDLSIAWGSDPFGTTLTIVQQGADAIIKTIGGSTRYILRNVNATDLSSYNLGVSTATFHNPAARNFAGTPAADTYISADGSDTLSGQGDNDTLYGAGGNDVIDGGAGDDSLYGGTGNDVLFGGAGIDRLSGGDGNDQLWVDDAGDTVDEGAEGGTDAVYTSASYELTAGADIEILSASALGATAALTLVGNSGIQLIYGNAGANLITGGGGADQLVGLGGDDTYIITDGAEAVFEAAGGGTDIVYTHVSHVLAGGQEIELLSTTSNSGTEALDLTGNEAANTIYGNNGTNNLRGGGGNGDKLIGLGGSDVYFIVSGTEQLFEAAGEGTDVVYTNVSHTLVSGQEIEILSAVSNSATNAMDLTGNDLANVIYANNGVNNLRGGGGADTMVGYGGGDAYYIVSGSEQVIEAVGGGYDVVYTNLSYTLGAGQEIEYLSAVSNGATTAMDLTGNAFGNQVHGNNGVNVINGGLGADLLVGYGGADSFAFTTALGSGNVDTLGDFFGGSDKILLDDAVFTGLGLGALSASQFATGSAQDADDRIIYNAGTGIIFFDADGNGAGAAVAFATVAQNTVLTASDFTVI